MHYKYNKKGNIFREISQITIFPCRSLRFVHNASIKIFELQKSNHNLSR